jgi:hypothetical protein
MVRVLAEPLWSCAFFALFSSSFLFFSFLSFFHPPSSLQEVLVHLESRGQPPDSRTVTMINSVHFRDLQAVLEKEFEMPLRITGLKSDHASAGIYDGQTLSNGQSLGSILESWEDVRGSFVFFFFFFFFLFRS